MASPSSSFLQSPPSLFPLHHLFSTIPEGEREEGDEAQTPEEAEGDDTTTAAASAAADRYQHRPTPLHPATPSFESAATRPAAPKKAKRGLIGEDERVVSCNKCRPSAREKISVVPLRDGGKGGHGRASCVSRSPKTNGAGLKSFFSSLTWRSPRLSSSSGAPPKVTCSQEEEWRLAAADLSHKLIRATRQRDEALLEASRLKHSMADLEKKLTGLENYCHDLKSAVDLCEHANPQRRPPSPAQTRAAENMNFPLQHFLCAVAEARSATRQFSRSLVAQIRRAGAPPKVHERILQLLQPGDACRIVSGSCLLLYLEALLSRFFFEDFESAGFQRGGSDRVLDPRTRAESYLASYAALSTLSWEDVLSRGTRRYCEDFSRFCDRKMSDVAGTVLDGGLLRGKGGAWPEPLLQAFFGAAKGVWLVHLLAWCDHPAVPVFRVGKGVPFDARYMEDVAANRGARLAPAAVKVMLAPGFYVGDSVVKCKVLCMYHDDSVVNGDTGKIR